MVALVFPVLPGAAWPVTKNPTFETRIQRGDSGVDARLSDFPNPVWQFELVHEFLRGAAGGSNLGGIEAEAGMLHGFYTACRGAWSAFFYDDPEDDQVAGMPIAEGDGVTTQFQLVRYIGDPTGLTPGFNEAVTAPKAGSERIYLNGTPQPGGAAYTLDQASGALVFASPPASGVVITADFGFWFRCRFSTANLSIDEFMNLWHGVKSLKFQSALGDLTPAP